MSDSLPLSIHLRPSRVLIGVLTVGHLAVGASLVFALPVYGCALGLPLASWSLWHCLVGHGLRRAARAAMCLRIEADDRVMLTLADGSVLRTQLLPTSFVHPRLTVLNLREEGRRLSCHVIILPDAVDAQAFRRLRVWLRWGYRGPQQKSRQDEDLG